MSAVTPQIRENICTDPNKPLYPPIEVGSSFWFTWLREPDVRSFHFESECGKFTARKEERATSTNEYWYAYRKIQGKLRKVYLGAMDDELTADRLNQVAADISQSGQDYYYSRKSYIASREKNSTTATTAASLTLENNGYPTKEVISCVTGSSEMERMRSQLEDERAEKNAWMDSASQWQSIAEQSQQESQELRTEQQEMDTALTDLLARISDKDKGYLANSFSKGIKEIRSLAERRGLIEELPN